MTSTNGVRDQFLETVDPGLAPIVVALDEAICTAEPGLTSRISYKMLMYVRGKEHRNWVAAIDARPKAVSLRFLYGAELTDPGRLLRPGTSSLSSIDYAALEQVDRDVVQRLLHEALAGHDQFTAKWDAIRAAKKANA